MPTIPELPPLPSMGVGSLALPGWMFPVRQAMREGRLGPADVEEAFLDATRAVIADQTEAGIDILSDGELRRQRFVYEMYERLDGLERTPPARRLGVPGYDQAPRFRALGPVRAPHGLGLVEELDALRRLAPPLPLKVAFPGPLTFALNIDPGPHYTASARTRTEAEDALLADLVRIVAREVDALAEAGADLVQIDEPGLARAPFGRPVEAAADIVNAALAGRGSALSVHVCFGNNASRPFAPRSFERLRRGLERLRCGELVLELANREMAELELVGALAERFHIAAGVVDVKSFHEESPAEVAERIARVLRHVPAARLTVTADCGFSAIPRWLARRKLQALGAGAAMARERL